MHAPNASGSSPNPATGSIAPLLADRHEACRILGGVCGKTVDNYRKRGLIPFVKIGSRTLFPVQGLADFVAANTQRVAATESK